MDMLKLNDIIKLSESGFTKDEIQQMIQAEIEEGANPQETPETPETDPVNEKINKLADSIDKLGTLLIQSNINNSNMPEPQSAQDILATIINPSIYENGGK